MNRSALVIAAVLSTAGFAAHAESPNPSGQFAHPVTQQAAPQAAVQGSKAAPGNSANPWSTRYNPLDSFRSERTRAEVTAEYTANRDRVSAFTGQDSGSAYLSARRGMDNPSVLAGQPVNAQ